MRRRYRREIKLAISAISIVILAISYYQQQHPDAPLIKTLAATQPGLYQVTQAIDGDTIEINMNGKTEKVRFIGVDTPETHDPRKAVQCFGKAAAAFTKTTLKKQGNRVRLEADPLNTNRDRYDRLLRYVFLPDNTLLNAKIIQDGYGFAYLSFPFSKADDFRAYEIEARTAEKGLWGTCQPTINPYGGYTSNDEQ